MLRIILAYTAGLLAAQTLPVLLPWWAGALVLLPSVETVMLLNIT